MLDFKKGLRWIFDEAVQQSKGGPHKSKIYIKKVDFLKYVDKYICVGTDNWLWFKQSMQSYVL